jgi:TolB protein
VRSGARALTALLAVALAGCGGGGGSTPCGAEGEACCASGAACEAALVCEAAACRACPLDEAGVTWLAFTTVAAGNYDLTLVHADGGCLLPVVENPADDRFPTWTAAGGLGFSSTRSGGSSLYVHGLAAGTDVGIPTPGYSAVAPAFSPDGLWVAFEGKGAGATHSDVYRVLSVGGIPEALTSGTGTNAGPVYSPDGSKLYFVSNRAGAYQVYSMGADGSSQTLLAGTAGVLGRPAVSPDGATLAFSKLDSGGTAEVVLQDLTSNAQVVVSDLGDTDPAFDATGTRLAVSSTRGGDPAIWLIDAADGGNAVRVTTPGAGVVHGQPAFRP